MGDYGRTARVCDGGESDTRRSNPRAPHPPEYRGRRMCQLSGSLPGDGSKAQRNQARTSACVKTRLFLISGWHSAVISLSCF